jgi:hypothetical protein
MKKLTLVLAALAGVVATGTPAQTYPTRPITMIVPFAAGGPTDVIARIVGAVMGTAAETQFDRGPVSLMPERSHAAIAPPLRSGKHAVSDGRRDGAGD